MSVIAPSSPPSKPQTELYEIVRQRYPDAELDYHVYTWEGKSRWIDIAIPSLMVAIEYQGYPWHSGRIRRKADAARGEELEALGWRLIYVNKGNCLRFIAGMRRHVEEGVILPRRITGRVNNDDG